MQSFMIQAIRRNLFEPLWSGGPSGLSMLLDGLGITLIITLFAAILSIVLGLTSALCRLSRFKALQALSRLYTEIIRGTPVTVQLMIMYFVILAGANISATVAAILAFGINSGAYVSEIVRSGLQSVDKGQKEAAKSLGFGPFLTLKEIVLPQAFRIVLPTLGNEAVTMLKDTSVVGFIGASDLMRMGEKIRSVTYEAFVPLLAVAAIYLAMTLTLSRLQRILENRLAIAP